MLGIEPKSFTLSPFKAFFPFLRWGLAKLLKFPGEAQPCSPPASASKSATTTGVYHCPANWMIVWFLHVVLTGRLHRWPLHSEGPRAVVTRPPVPATRSPVGSGVCQMAHMCMWLCKWNAVMTVTVSQLTRVCACEERCLLWLSRHASFPNYYTWACCVVL